MDKRKTTAIALGAASLGLVVLGLRRGGSSAGPKASAKWTRKVPGGGSTPTPSKTSKGSVVCPAELGHLPASTVNAHPGDFVLLRLASAAGTFSEVVWAVIESIRNEGASKLPPGTDKSSAMRVRLVGTIGSSSVATPNTAKHGFDVGASILLDVGCAWEVFRTSSKGMALCGLFGQEVSGKGTPATAGAVVAGEEVLIYLAPVKEGAILVPGPGWDVANPVWARIVRVSSSGSILRVAILEPPAIVAGMTLVAGDELDISRDCVFGVRAMGA